MSEDISINNDKKIFSFNLKTNTVTRLDLLRSEPVTRSELVEALLEYLVDQPDFVSGFVREMQNKTQQKVQEMLASELIG